MTPKIIRIASGLVCAGILGCGISAHAIRPVPAAPQAQQNQAHETAVTIDNFKFSPQEITIAPGTTVVWTNKDDVPHTVVTTDKKVKSKALDTGEKFSFTFTAAGTYDYYCSVHPKMTAKVIVK